MIIFFSDGRLGNQLFDLAFVDKHSSDSELVFTTNMGLFLETFDTNKRIINIQNKYVVFLLRKLVKPLLEFASRLRLITIYCQKRKFMVDTFFPNNTYHQSKGILSFIKFIQNDFFQSEDFFDNKNFINKTTIKQKFLREAEEFLLHIPNSYHKVFVHVRRGDYINEVFLGEKGIDLPVEYFMNAIEFIKSQIPNPFFVFLSDDCGFCEYCFAKIEQKVISKNSMQTDLAIMILCDSGIMSNSSFSWWGSYLMKSRKIVIAPKYWYGWKQKILSHIAIYPSFAEVIDPIRNRFEKELDAAGLTPKDMANLI